MAEFDKFLQNVNKLERTNFESGLSLADFGMTQSEDAIKGPIAKFLPPVDEAIKKYLAEKIPGLKKEHIDLIVDSPAKIKKKFEEAEKRKEEREAAKRKKKEEEASMTDEQLAQRKEEEKARKRAAAKARRDKFLAEMKKIYDPMLKELKKEVLELIKDIATGFFLIVEKAKEAGKKLVFSVISIVTAIPDAVLKTFTLPPNVPGAINTVILIIDTLLSLAALLKDMVPFLKPLKYLPLVTDKKNLEGFAGVMNVILETIFSILQVVQGFENIIFFLIDALLKLLSSIKESTFKRATKRLKKLGHLKKLELPLPEEAIDVITNLLWGSKNRGKLYKTDGDPPDDNGELLKLSDDTVVEVYSFSPDDVPEIVSLLDQFVVANNRVVAYRKNIEQDAEKSIAKLRDELKAAGEINVEPKEVNELEQFVYDIELPDGTIVYGVSEEAIEFYRSKYTLNFEFETREE